MPARCLSSKRKGHFRAAGRGTGGGTGGQRDRCAKPDQDGTAKGYQYSAEKLEERKYRVLFTLGEVVSAPAEDAPVCTSDARTDTVVAISAAVMGDGSEELGKTLLKAFVFALTQQDKLPKTILFYNGGAASL